MSIFSLKATWQKVTAIVGALVIIATVVGATVKIDTRYAKQTQIQTQIGQVSEAVTYVGKRLDQKILQDRINDLQDRIWKIEDRYRGRVMPQDAIEAIRQYRKEIKQLERQLRKG